MAVDSLDERVERAMWKRLCAASYVTMDRKRQHNHRISHAQNHLGPILNANTVNSLNRRTSTTENSSMPNNKEKTSHRVVLVKGDDQWRFEWEVGKELETVEAITEIAKSPDTDFDWFDAAMVCHEMSKITAKAA
jgi:hypothetical protein